MISFSTYWVNRWKTSWPVLARHWRGLMTLRRQLTPSWTPSLMKYSCVFHNHHPQLLHHYNNNNNHLHVAKQPSAERAVFLLSSDKILVPLLLLLMLL